MLKHRLIFGLLIGLAVLAIFYLDNWLAGNWPRMPWYSPPGALLVLAMLAVIPFALREMQTLLASDNVHISLRITTLATMLCMVWPWIEQVALVAVPEDRAPPTASLLREPPVPRLPDEPVNSTWSTIGRNFRTVKPAYLVPTVLAAALILAFVYHTRRQKVEGAMANAGGTLLAIVYLGVLPSFYFPISLSHGTWMVLGIVAMVKAADIGAYTAGRLLGHHKLISWLSPGKTVEGFIGGLILAALVGMLVAWITTTFGGRTGRFNLWQGAIIGSVLGAVGQLGDLVESLLKRDAGVKDSGRVPGFGGILDILDSPLLAAPVAYWLLKLLRP